MAATITVEPAGTKKELDTLIKFPYQHYRGSNAPDNKWVPPLLMDEKNLFNKEKDPFYKHAEAENFICRLDGTIAGRISAIIDHEYIEYHKTKTGFFGFFECIDNQECADRLVKAASDWLKEHGMTRMIGPMNPSTNHMLGVLINNFETPPVVQMGYNYPYYDNLLLQSGLQKEKDLFSYIMSKDTLELSDKIKRVAEISQKRNRITIEHADLKKFDELVETIREIYNDAWGHNWGFVPWTKEEFKYLAKDLKLIINPELVFLAKIDGRPVGFALPIPDVNQIFIRMNGRLFPSGLFKLLFGRKNIDLIRVAAFGVREKYQNIGIDAIFIYYLYTRGVALGMKGAEFSWILEDNIKLRNLLENWGASHYKTHRIYGRDLA
jgi:GNAT superfamily N-acetyltransferase